MAGTIKPRDAEELRQAVEWALNDGATLDVRGQGSKLALGKPMTCDQVLDLSGLSGIVDYAPEELVVTLRAGTPMREVEALLAQRNQMLAFEPPDLGPLLGREAGQGTLVGAVMGNLAGPRRLSAGAARDHLLGFSGVNGRGEAFKSGGKVMKNVTGYDLSKLLAGSWGTLAVLDEVSVKVLPAPDQTRTLMLLGLSDEAAVKAMCAAMGSPHDVSGAAHVEGRTALRLEGVAPSVEARLKGLRDLLARRREDGRTRHARKPRPSGARCATWRRLSDARDAVVWKISCPPTEGPGIVARIKAQRPSARAFYDWSGGLVWLALPPSADADHAIVRGALGADRRPRHPDSCARSGARRRAGVPAAAAGARGAGFAREGELRSQGSLQSGAHGLTMQTNFTLAQLADPETARSEHILRKCVHCGFCTATCPTYVLLGDERDSPRGRIYFIKAMLEGDRAPTASEVRHVDRCLSCLSCMTTCPSGVHYMHLVDHGRHHIEETFHASAARPAAARAARLADAATGGCSAGPWCWAGSPSRWRRCCRRRSADPGGATFLRRLRAMLEAVPDRLAGPSPVDRPQTFAGGGPAAQARGADAGLRPAGAGARGQRGDGAAADPPRHRGGERRGLGLLRLVGAACRPQRARPSRSPSATSRPGCARSTARASTPSSSTPRAAAPR